MIRLWHRIEPLFRPHRLASRQKRTNAQQWMIEWNGDNASNRRDDQAPALVPEHNWMIQRHGQRWRGERGIGSQDGSRRKCVNASGSDGEAVQVTDSSRNVTQEHALDGIPRATKEDTMDKLDTNGGSIWIRWRSNPNGTQQYKVSLIG